ncbi:MAG: quinone oxidoreductase [Rhodospirillaceae bacterium]
MTSTAKAIRIHEHGGPDVMKWEDVKVGDPGPGQVRLRHTAVGLNFIDINHRAGTYPVAKLPATIGMEAAGVVEAAGEGAGGFQAGDRVSHCMVIGAYSEKMIVAADRLIRLRDRTPDEIAAAATLQGLTAHYLLHESWPLRPGQTALVQAAAGGVGLLLCQWAKHIGATVIGTVGSDEKGEYARAHGCDYPVNYMRDDFAAKVKEITGGRGVDVVYDAIGRTTFAKGLDCLAERGRMVSYGVASGPIEPVDLGVLRSRSASVAAGGLGTFIRDPEERARNADLLFGLIADGTLKVEINQRYALSDAAAAHRDLAGRRTTGSSILLV